VGVLVAAEVVRVRRTVDAQDGGGGHEQRLVVRGGRRRVEVVVPAVAVRAEPVEVLHAQVQPLQTHVR
jgi:hypothetical protein